MLTTTCIHPQILAALALCGHGDQILIADGNFPLETHCPNAELVYLGYCAGSPRVDDVLEALCGVANFEKAEVMSPGEGPEPEVFERFRQILELDSMDGMDRYAFYEACNSKVKLAISTGEKRIFSNILLTMGTC